MEIIYSSISLYDQSCKCFSVVKLLRNNVVYDIACFEYQLLHLQSFDIYPVIDRNKTYDGTKQDKTRKCHYSYFIDFLTYLVTLHYSPCESRGSRGTVPPLSKCQ